MKHFVVAIVTILSHKVLTELLSISYPLFSRPFRPLGLLVDIAIFAAIYIVVAAALRGWGSRSASAAENDTG